MTGRRSNTVHVTKSPTGNNLKLIQGVGPIIEKCLHAAGIHTFSGLAALSAKEIADLVPGKTAQQIAKQGWITQARKLTRDKAKSKTHKKKTTISTIRQHYENFTFEFLLDEKNRIRRLRVVHVQSGDLDTWGNWDAERLIDFLARHTKARLPYVTPAVLNPIKPKRTPKQSGLNELPSKARKETTLKLPVRLLKENAHSPSPITSESPPKSPTPASTMTREIVHQQGSSPQVITSSINKIHVLEWKVLLGNTDQPLINVHPDQLFDVRLTLDLNKVILPDGSYFQVNGTLYAKKLGGGQHQMISEIHDVVPYAKIIVLTIGGARLSAGYYHLETLITLKLVGSKGKRPPGLIDFLEVGLIQVC